MNANLRIGLIIFASVGNVLFIIGLSTNYWLKSFKQDFSYIEIINTGLWVKCNRVYFRSNNKLTRQETGCSPFPRKGDCNTNLFA